MGVGPPIPRFVVFTWCRGWESNPHDPCGSRDFKSLSDATRCNAPHRPTWPFPQNRANLFHAVTLCEWKNLR